MTFSEISLAIKNGEFDKVKKYRKGILASYIACSSDTLPHYMPYSKAWEKYIQSESYKNIVKVLKAKSYTSDQPYINNLISRIFDEAYSIFINTK